MPVYLDDPSVLTKERLKRELRAHNVELPGGNPTKDVYVQLYVKTVSAQSQGTEPLDAFSSDEELPPPVVSQTRRSRSSGRKSVVAVEHLDMVQMSDEDLRDQLLKHGFHAGPIIASTRKLYENKLLKLLDTGAILSESRTHSNIEKDDVYSDQEEEIGAAPGPAPVAEVKLESVPVKSSSVSPSTRRHSGSQHSMSTQVEKTTTKQWPSEEDTALPELNSLSGLTATCRRPIKGSACRPVIGDFTHSFECQNSICNSAPTAACSTPTATSSAPFITSLSAVAASSTPPTACQPNACGMLWWKKLLLLAFLVFFVFFMFQAMELNSTAPFEQSEEL